MPDSPPPLRPLDLAALHLSPGSHAEGSDEVCVMEAAAHLAGEGWTDQPVSVSPVIRELVQGLNDSMNDADRQGLKSLIRSLPGSRGEGELEVGRSWKVMDWHCRTWASAWLRGAGCIEEAAALESTALITGMDSLTAALHPLSRARAAAAARYARAVDDSVEESLASLVVACGAETGDPAIVGARDAIKGGTGRAALAALRHGMPASARLANAGARCSDALDASLYAFAIADVAAPRAAVRALASSSAWRSGWETPRAGGALEGWDRARDDARRTGRDAALAVAWRAAWPAAAKADQRAAWLAATDAATAALRPEVVALQLGAAALVAALVELRPGS